MLANLGTGDSLAGAWAAVGPPMRGWEPAAVERVELSAGITRPAHWNDDPSRAPALGSFPFQKPGEPTELNLSDSQIFSGRLATVAHFLVAHLGTFIEAAQSRSFDGRDVHEDILAAAVGLNESISLGCVEPLHSTCRH